MGLNNNGQISGAGYPGCAYVLDAGSLLVVPDLPGGFNFDGAVDAADYVLWRKNDGSLEEYNTWRANFGNTAMGAANAASIATVPEPNAWLLTVLAVAVFGSIRRQRM